MRVRVLVLKVVSWKDRVRISVLMFVLRLRSVWICRRRCVVFLLKFRVVVVFGRLLMVLLCGGWLCLV